MIFEFILPWYQIIISRYKTFTVADNMKLYNISTYFSQEYSRPIWYYFLIRDTSKYFYEKKNTCFIGLHSWQSHIIMISYKQRRDYNIYIFPISLRIFVLLFPAYVKKDLLENSSPKSLQGISILFEFSTKETLNHTNPILINDYNIWIKGINFHDFFIIDVSTVFKC